MPRFRRTRASAPRPPGPNPPAETDRPARLDPPTAALMEGAPPGGTEGRTTPHDPATPDAPTRSGEADVSHLPG